MAKSKNKKSAVLDGNNITDLPSLKKALENIFSSCFVEDQLKIDVHFFDYNNMAEIDNFVFELKERNIEFFLEIKNHTKIIEATHGATYTQLLEKLNNAEEDSNNFNYKIVS